MGKERERKIIRKGTGKEKKTRGKSYFYFWVSKEVEGKVR